jgi:hypothetical protein
MWLSVFMVQIGIGELLKAAHPLCASLADRAQSVEPGSGVRPHGPASPHPTVNEFRSGLFANLPNLFASSAGRTLRVRGFEPADCHHRDMRPAGKCLLLNAEQGPSGTDLLRGDFHER